MNWFEVIKENRLVTDTVTHTKVDEKKEPEKEDGRCKEKLRRIIFKAWDGWRETQAQNEQIADYFNHPMNMIQQDMTNAGITVMAYKSAPDTEDEIANMLNNKEDILEDVPEETCCRILELMQELDNQKVSNFPEGPQLYSTEDNLFVNEDDRIGFVNMRVAKEFYDDGFDRLTMEDLDDFDQVNKELGTYYYEPREIVCACFKKFTMRVGWDKNNRNSFLTVTIYVGQIMRLDHWDCVDCEEYRERMMRETDDKFSELIR